MKLEIVKDFEKRRVLVKYPVPLSETGEGGPVLEAVREVFGDEKTVVYADLSARCGGLAICTEKEVAEWRKEVGLFL